MSRNAGFTQQRRQLLTLAIESSCDDTAVAILERHSDPPRAQLHFNEKVTANTAEHRGIHPLVALESHQKNLAALVQRALPYLPDVSLDTESHISPADSLIRVLPAGATERRWKKRPDFISVTRGPGMRSNLSTGIDVAKGLAVAWGVPLVGVHHMQAHALTPGLFAAMSGQEGPRFPFLTLLVSGGHTILLHSSGLTEHRILADSDMPVGSAIDKIARMILPDDIFNSSTSTMYGAILERFAFPDTNSHHYEPPATKGLQSRSRNPTAYPWSYKAPLYEAKGGIKKDSMEFSFSGIVSATERFVTYEQRPGEETRNPRKEAISDDERRALAQEAMRVCFEHLASRVVLALEAIRAPVSDLVVSGGVASNQYLRHILKSWLTTRGYPDVKLNCPPPSLCTDNAAMIAWAGCEMYEQGWRSDLSISARRKWPLGPREGSTREGNLSDQGEDQVIGVLGINGWFNVKV